VIVIQHGAAPGHHGPKALAAVAGNMVPQRTKPVPQSLTQREESGLSKISPTYSSASKLRIGLT
jgi:hypothetical protein